MLSNAHNLAIPLSLHNALHCGQSLAHLKRLTLNDDLLALGYGSEIGDVQIAGDAEELPESRLTNEDKGDGGAQVKEGGCRTAVEVTQAVAVLF